MLIPIPAVRRRSRSFKRRAIVLPRTLNLASAAYVYDDSAVLLGFDGPIDIAAFDPTAVLVLDPVQLGQRLVGSDDVTLVDPSTLRSVLRPDGDASGTVQTLTVIADSGIVGADGGPVWAGVSDLVLPFP